MSKKPYAERNLKFETLQLHVGQEQPDPVTGARAVPIYQTSSYVFRNCDHAAARFGLEDPGEIYGRLGNPTQGVFEQRIAALEGGTAALAVASGAAAICYTIQNLAKQGDHIVSANNIYGGTYNLLAHTLVDYGVTTTFVAPSDYDRIEASFRENTKALYIETLGNPNSDVVDIERLAQIFLELQQQGANNINLVTAGHFVPQVIDALDRVRHQLHIPVVYNSSGYETVQTLRMLAGYVDVYLPDLKFYSPERSARYCSAPDYFAVASAAVQEMFAQTGPVQLDSRGIIQRGTIVRHMVMPDGVEDSMDILSWIAEHLPLDDILVSVMSQYTPFYKSTDYPEINRRLLPQEYERVLDWMECMGIENGFVQELSSAKEEYTPDFSLQGI